MPISRSIGMRIAALALAFGLVACATAGPATAPSTGAGANAKPAARTTAGGRAGGVLYANGDRLYVIDPDAQPSAGPRALLESQGKGTIADPAWSPDRSRIAYSFTAVPAPGATFGSDIYVMDADGANRRAVVTHDVDGGLARAPVWSADGQSLYFSYSFSRKPPGQAQFETIQRVERLDLASGARAVVAADADLPSVSADGASLSFIRLPTDPSGGLPASPPGAAPPATAGPVQLRAPSLWIARPDGAEARPVVESKPFTTLWAARFSPDGRTMVFSAAGGDRSQPRLRIAPSRDTGGGWPPSVSAHGFPLDLWSVDIATGKLELLAALAADDLYAVYAPDGRRLALQSADGLFVVDLATAAVTPLTAAPGFGAIDWSR
jgi:Tol biopolymer transport system component